MIGQGVLGVKAGKVTRVCAEVVLGQGRERGAFDQGSFVFGVLNLGHFVKVLPAGYRSPQGVDWLAIVINSPYFCRDTQGVGLETPETFFSGMCYVLLLTRRRSRAFRKACRSRDE